MGSDLFFLFGVHLCEILNQPRKSARTLIAWLIHHMLLTHIKIHLLGKCSFSLIPKRKEKRKKKRKKGTP
jgi:hypothetical protein